MSEGAPAEAGYRLQAAAEQIDNADIREMAEGLAEYFHESPTPVRVRAAHALLGLPVPPLTDRERLIAAARGALRDGIDAVNPRLDAALGRLIDAGWRPPDQETNRG